MAEFSLPRNSRIIRGREWNPQHGKRLKTFKVYRYDPDSGANPRFDNTRSISTNAGRWSSTR